MFVHPHNHWVLFVIAFLTWIKVQENWSKYNLLLPLCCQLFYRVLQFALCVRLTVSSRFQYTTINTNDFHDLICASEVKIARKYSSEEEQADVVSRPKVKARALRVERLKLLKQLLALPSGLNFSWIMFSIQNNIRPIRWSILLYIHIVEAPGGLRAINRFLNFSELLKMLCGESEARGTVFNRLKW